MCVLILVYEYAIINFFKKTVRVDLIRHTTMYLFLSINNAEINVVTLKMHLKCSETIVTVFWSLV